jgi:hypothetical protein
MVEPSTSSTPHEEHETIAEQTLPGPVVLERLDCPM